MICFAQHVAGMTCKILSAKNHTKPHQSSAGLIHKTSAPRHGHGRHIYQEPRKCCCLLRLDGLSHSDHQDAPQSKQALRTVKPQFFGDAPFVLSLWRFHDAAPFSPLVDEHPSRKLRPSKSVLVALAPTFSPATPGGNKYSSHPHASSLFLLLAGALLLQHLLDDLLLLDQERADDAVAHAVAAPRTAVCALDGLLGLGDLGVLAGTQGGDLVADSVSHCPYIVAALSPPWSVHYPVVVGKASRASGRWYPARHLFSSSFHPRPVGKHVIRSNAQPQSPAL